MPENKLHSLYPDIVEHGSLGKLLNAKLERGGFAITAVGFEESIDGSRYWASVKSENRSCDISCAVEMRTFTAPLWLNGVLLATVNTDSTDHLAKILHDWFSMKYSATELKKHHQEIGISDVAAYYEKGPQEFVAHQWNTIIKYIEVDFPDLVPVVQKAYLSKAIKSLYPFTSHDQLCFSRCTGYPYTHDCPYIVPLYGEKGVYQVYSPKGELLGKGSPQEAVNIAIKNLPVNCGPAIHGTAENIKIAQPSA